MRHASKQRLRVTLHHLQPQVPPCEWVAGTCAAVAAADSFFPRGFNSHGPESDIDPVAAQQMCLSPKEVEFFKGNGFLVKRGLIPRADLAPWVEHMQQALSGTVVSASTTR